MATDRVNQPDGAFASGQAEALCWPRTRGRFHWRERQPDTRCIFPNIAEREIIFLMLTSLRADGHILDKAQVKLSFQG